MSQRVRRISDVAQVVVQLLMITDGIANRLGAERSAQRLLCPAVKEKVVVEFTQDFGLRTGDRREQIITLGEDGIM